MVAKLVDDIKITGIERYAKRFISDFNNQFKFGKVTSGLGIMRIFGINTVQESDMTVKSDADDKLNSLTEYFLTRLRRKQSSLPISNLERSQFEYTSSSFGVDWYGWFSISFILCFLFATEMSRYEGFIHD